MYNTVLYYRAEWMVSTERGNFKTGIRAFSPRSPPLSFLPSSFFPSLPPLPSPFSPLLYPLPPPPPPPQCPASSDENHLLPLVMEVVPQHACLVFCPTKKNCENVALLLAQNLPRWVDPPFPASCVEGLGPVRVCSSAESTNGLH